MLLLFFKDREPEAISKGFAKQHVWLRIPFILYSLLQSWSHEYLHLWHNYFQN